MSDIYCHEDILDFTNLFLDYEQGHHSIFTKKLTTIPVSPKTVLLEEPLTRQGYLRGESQGDSHWGQGPLEMGGHMSGTLKGQNPFSWHVSVRHILCTFQM